MGDYPQAHLHLHSSERQDVSEDDWSIILMAVVSLYWGCLRGEWKACDNRSRCNADVTTSKTVFWSVLPFLKLYLKVQHYIFWFCTHINLNTLKTSQPQQFGNSTPDIFLHKVNLFSCGLPLAEPPSPGNPVDFPKNRSHVGNWVTEPVICK